MMIDSHAHMCYPTYDKDRERIVGECRKRLKAVIASSARYDESLKVLELCAMHNGFLYATIGCHPTELQDAEKVLDLIQKNKGKIAGIGEAGLDYHWVKEPEKRLEQKAVFEKFISLAEELNLPLVIHSWDAEQDCFEMVKGRDAFAVFHCYSGSRELEREIIRKGHMISVSTQACFSKSHRKLARDLPLENLLLETDSPFLSPVKTEEEKRNFPWNITYAAEMVAKEKGIGAEKVMEAAEENARRVFRI